MFQFGFNNSVESESSENTSTVKIKWREAKEVSLDLSKYKDLGKNTKIFDTCDAILKYITPNEVINNLKKSEDVSNSILQAESNHSDLIPGKYEGGLKIWECTVDLINFLYKENVLFANKKVLDLGCGAGILGIYSLLKDSFVDFQDYNEEVIECTTMPNVILNIKFDEKKLENCKFYCGDWEYFSKISKRKYDYILTSETIYNPDNYQKLLELFNNLLEENGIIYLAAKTYYFGVGGSLRQFEEIIKKSGFFNSIVCWKNSDGVQREILKIIKKY